MWFLLPSQHGLMGRAGIRHKKQHKKQEGKEQRREPCTPCAQSGLPSWAAAPIPHLTHRQGGSCATELHREPGLQQSSCARISSCFPASTWAEREIPWIPRMSFPNRHHEHQLEAPQAQLGEVLGGFFLAARGPSAALSNRKETWTPKPGAAFPSIPLR